MRFCALQMMRVASIKGPRFSKFAEYIVASSGCSDKIEEQRIRGGVNSAADRYIWVIMADMIQRRFFVFALWNHGLSFHS